MKPLKKSHFLLLIGLLLSTLLPAQVSINSSHMPQGGDTLRYSITATDLDVLQSYADTGANRVWNFDSIFPLRQGVSSFVNSSQTPYNNINNKVGEKLLDTITAGDLALYDIYDFYSNSSAEYALDQRGFTFPTGLSFPFPATIKFTPNFDDKDEVYQFPLNYLDRDSSNFEFSFSNILPPVYYGSQGYRINEVEAWGTITTPYGTFSCIKVKTDIVAYDTVSFDGTAIADITHTREYKWLSPQEAIPIASLTGNVIGDLFLPITFEYRDSVRDVPSLLSPIALFIADTNTVRIGDTLELINLSISLLGATYQWDISPNTFAYVDGTSANSQNPLVIFSDSGLYDVSLIVTNSQGADTLSFEDFIEVKGTVGLNDLRLAEEKFNIYPNPVFDSRIKIESLASVDEVRLFDLNHRQIEQWIISDKNEFSIELDSELPKGVYFLQIQTDLGEFSKKLIIQ